MNAAARMQFRFNTLFRIVNYKFRVDERKLFNRAYSSFRNHLLRPYISNDNNDNYRKYSNAKPDIKENNYDPLQNPGEDRKGDQRSIPRLMEFPEIMWPSFFHSIRNWMLVHCIIRPYFDHEFYMKDFVFGAHKAIEVVSSKLMNSDFDSLNNLVTHEALNQLRPVVEKLSISQRRQLEVRESDIYLSFPYQVGIMFDDDKDDKLLKRWVEITMVSHVFRGLKEMREAKEEIPWNLGTRPEYGNKICICNYRFIKEFTRGHESDWTVNVINHFKPTDMLKERNRP